jgi:ribosomal protein S18 acetylase RimI-like enzyme
MTEIIETVADLPEYRRIFVDAFSEEPSFRFMLPDEETRKANVAWLVDKKLSLLGRSFHALSTAGEKRGFAWWIPPGRNAPVNLLSQLKVGYWKAPFQFGPQGFLRMYRFGKQESRILRKYLSEPYWVLDVIATDPAHQRSGLGGALMAPIFEKSKAENIPCFVLTHNPRNVRFYEKYGFKKVIEEPVMGPGTPLAYGLERRPGALGKV